MLTHDADQIAPVTGHRPLRFSVAMCTYNGVLHLPEQLDSIARQQRPPDELVVCDDSSTDHTVQVLESFAGQVSFPVRIVRNDSNLGYQRNFLKAIALCSGDLVALSDQDDVWYPSKLARLETIFAANSGLAGVFSNGDLIDTSSNRLSGDLWSSFAFRPDDLKRFDSGHVLEVLLQRNVVTGMAFAFRSCCKNQLAAIPASWPHDAWLALMLANQGKLSACPEHLVAYRVHNNQTIGVPVTSAEKSRFLRGHGIAAYLQQSRERNVREYRRDAELFTDLLQVYAADTSPGNKQLILHAHAKLNHAKAAADRLNRSRLRRWPAVLGNRQAYQRYSSTGLNAMFRDLVL